MLRKLYAKSRNRIFRFTNGFVLNPAKIRFSIYQTELEPNWQDSDAWLHQYYPFTETPIFRSFQERHLDGKHWDQTEYYSMMLDGFHNKRLQRFDGDVRSYFDHYDRLYDSIRTTGYDSSTKRRPIFVLGGQGTDLVRIDGNHRLAIALILNVSKVRVAYKYIHDDHVRQDSLLRLF